MDFDPVSGLIRVITDTNQNLRIDPETGDVTADTAISGVPGLVGLAFTNNFASPDRATLFAISHDTNLLARIGGVDLTDDGASQAAGAATAIGGLTLDADAPMGFDIAANDNAAFAVLTPAGDTESSLYRINLANGTATLIREVTVAERLRGLALVSRAVTLYALGRDGLGGNTIVTLLSAAPGAMAPGTSSVSITGLKPANSVQRIATRPEDGRTGRVDLTGRLLNINPGRDRRRCCRR